MPIPASTVSNSIRWAAMLREDALWSRSIFHRGRLLLAQLPHFDGAFAPSLFRLLVGWLPIAYYIIVCSSYYCIRLFPAVFLEDYQIYVFPLACVPATLQAISTAFQNPCQAAELGDLEGSWRSASLLNWPDANQSATAARISAKYGQYWVSTTECRRSAMTMRPSRSLPKPSAV